MNVRIFPGAGTTTGGWTAIVVMIAVVGILYAMFRKQDWL